MRSSWPPRKKGAKHDEYACLYEYAISSTAANAAKSGYAEPTVNAATNYATAGAAAGFVTGLTCGANNCVYIKHWNAQTGAAEFMDYFPPMPIAPQAQEQQPQPNQEPPAFASLQALADLQNMVNNQQQQLENIEKRLNQERLADKPNGKAEKKNDAK